MNRERKRDHSTTSIFTPLTFCWEGTNSTMWSVTDKSHLISFFHLAFLSGETGSSRFRSPKTEAALFIWYDLKNAHNFWRIMLSKCGAELVEKVKVFHDRKMVKRIPRIYQQDLWWHLTVPEPKKLLSLHRTCPLPRAVLRIFPSSGPNLKVNRKQEITIV